MKLLTHNMLQCHIKGVKNGYPFKIEANETATHEAELNPGKAPSCERQDRLRVFAHCVGAVARTPWYSIADPCRTCRVPEGHLWASGLERPVRRCRGIGVYRAAKRGGALPVSSRSPSLALTPRHSLQASAADLEDEEFLRKLHHALLELELEDGALVCPETGRRFEVKRGIPNLLLREDEV